MFVVQSWLITTLTLPFLNENVCLNNYLLIFLRLK